MERIFKLKLMKIRISFFIILSILIISPSINECLCWFPLNSGTTRNLNDILFINMNTGWVGGDSVLLKTTNGGINWSLQSIPVQIKIRALYFTSEFEGYILGDWSSSTPMVSNIYFLKTTNSGNSWSILHQQQFMGTGLVAYSKNFLIVNDNVILRTLTILDGSTSGGGIMKSTNGGINFYSVLNFGDMTGISFIDLYTGWAIGTASSGSPLTGVFKVFKTTNQGENWFPVYTDSQPNSGGLQGKAIKFFNQNTGYILASFENTFFMKTYNGGVNWSVSQYSHYNNRTMFFCDLNTGWLAGNISSGNSNIRKTIDGGINWIQQNLNGNQVINKLFFLNNNIGWAVGDNGIILKTTNGGSSYIKSVSTEIPDKYFLKQNYPNPFNSQTRIDFYIPESGNIKIFVYDLLGKEITTIVDEFLQPGIYAVYFDAGFLTSGIYFYKLFSTRFTDVKSMILIK